MSRLVRNRNSFCFALWTLALLVGCAAGSIQSARAETYCVDVERGQAGASGSCAPGVDGLWSDPLSSIGEALERAAGGDQVWIAAGLYRESALVVPQAAALIGGFAGHEQDPADRDVLGPRVVLLVEITNAPHAGLELLGSALLEEITLRSAGGGAGIGVRLACDAGRPGGELALRGAIVQGFDEGVLLEIVSLEETQGCEVRADIDRSVFLGNRLGVSSRAEGAAYSETKRFARVTRSVFENNRASGVRFAPARPGAHVESRLEVSDSLVRGSESGIEAQNRFGAANLVVRNVYGRDNTRAVSASSQSPFREEDGSPKRLDGRAYSWDMQLVGNTLIDNDYGVFFYQDDLIDDHEIWSNYATRNRIDGIFHANSSGEAAARVEGNWLFENGRAGFLHGGHVCGVQHVRRNRITRNVLGFWSRDNGCEGFVVGGRPEWRNDLSGNRSYALAYDGLRELNAEWNYWGHNDHDAIQSLIAPGSGGPVDFVPWYWPLGGDPEDGSPPFVELFTRVLRPLALSMGPRPRGEATLAWIVDTDNSGAQISRVEATLRWDPRLVALRSWDAGAAGYDVSCSVDVGAGEMRCRAAHPEGAEGELELVRTRFAGALPFEWTPHFDIEVVAIEGRQGEDLRPQVMSHDDVEGWPF